MGKKAKRSQKTKSFAEKAANVTHPAPSRAIFDLQNRQNLTLISLLLFELMVWVFWPSLQGDFLYFDEHSYVVTNPHVNTGLNWQNIVWAITSLEFSNWYPLTWMSHMLDVQIYGMKPWGAHFTNILLHALNTVLVFLVFSRLTGANWRSLVVAGLFGLHPLRVESVAWISERKDVLSMMFWLLAMWTYVRFTEELKKPDGRIKTFYALTLLFFLFGLVSKTILVTLPFVLLLLDYWPLKRFAVADSEFSVKTIIKLVVEKIPFFALTAGVSILSYLAQHRGGMTGELPYLSFSQKLENAVISYPRYLGKFFWPENLCVYYPYQFQWPMPEVIVAALFLILVSALAFLLRRTRPYLFVGWFWFLGTFIPVINLVQLGSQSMADRYTYVPLIGIYLLLVWGLFELTQSWRRQVIILSAVSITTLTACAMTTRYEIQFWKDDVTVWKRATEVTENNYIAHNNLGVALETKDKDAAMAHFEEAVRLNPLYSGAQQSLADEYFNHGRIDDAIEHYQYALQIDPGSPWAEYGLALALANKQQFDKAIIHLQRAVDLDPSSSIYQNTLGVAFFKMKQYDKALQHFQLAVQSNPQDSEAQFDLGQVLLTLGHPAEAIKQFQIALKLKPDFSPARQRLTEALQAVSRTNQPAPPQQ